MANANATRSPENERHTDEANKLAQRVELEREIEQMPTRPLNNPLLTSTAIIIIAGVALAFVVAALFFALAS